MLDRDPASRAGPDEDHIVEEASLALVEMTLASLAAVPGRSVLQLRMLLAVDRHGPLNLSALAALLDLSVPSTSRLVDRLADAGLVTRDPAEHSRRELALRITPGGRRAMAQMRRSRRRAIGSVLGRMTGSERAALVTGLQAFAAAADA